MYEVGDHAKVFAMLANRSIQPSFAERLPAPMTLPLIFNEIILFIIRPVDVSGEHER